MPTTTTATGRDHDHPTAAPSPAPPFYDQLHRWLPTSTSVTTAVGLRLLVTAAWTLIAAVLVPSSWTVLMWICGDARSGADPVAMVLFGMPMVVGAATLPVAAVLVWLVPQRGGAKSKALLKQVGLVVPACGWAGCFSPQTLAGRVLGRPTAVAEKNVENRILRNIIVRIHPNQVSASANADINFPPPPRSSHPAERSVRMFADLVGGAQP
ncbi:hypothetical protein DFJ73DRAFT_803554 [Zopfochytrium polystomum]|nr:hypothetical protein DFJ73DRAFT_803554 [Zopfochytrium polystomum]